MDKNINDIITSIEYSEEQIYILKLNDSSIFREVIIKFLNTNPQLYSIMKHLMDEIEPSVFKKYFMFKKDKIQRGSLYYKYSCKLRHKIIDTQ
jgi:hypothetical protein